MSDGATPREHERYALAPSRGTFARPEIEAAFLAEHFERDAAGRRTRLLGALGVWSAFSALMGVSAADSVASWGPPIAFVWLVFVAVWRGIRARDAELYRRAALALNVSVGLCSVFVLRWVLDMPTSATTAVVFACFFNFSNPAIAPARVAGSVLPYVVLELLALATTAPHGAEPWLAIVLVAASLGVGYGVAVSAHRQQRIGYRQERIIDDQRAQIAEERARSEALLKQELGHQVAERSRELGAALARADVVFDARRLQPGERFGGRYRIVRLLGAGGMGVVYEVDRTTDGAKLALKAICGEMPAAAAARFAREAEIGARLRHPHLVSIVDVGMSAGVPFLAMDLVSGGSLEAQRARFGDPEWATPLLRQIALGLAALHQAGVIHRDLKPANVLLDRAGGEEVAKISDFGISRIGLDDVADPSAPTAPRGAAGSPALTGTGVVLGTPLYMAPEAAHGSRAVDAAADVFAFGIMAYEMMTGRAPFAVPAYLTALAQQPLPAPAPIETIPVEVDRLVRECLHDAPSKRPRIATLAAALERT